MKLKLQAKSRLGPYTNTKLRARATTLELERWRGCTVNMKAGVTGPEDLLELER